MLDTSTQLAPQPGATGHGSELAALLEKEFKPKTDEQRSAVQGAVRTLAEQALGSAVTFSGDAYRSIQAIIAEIDRKMSEQIIRHPEYQQLESTWRGLHNLVNGIEIFKRYTSINSTLAYMQLSEAAELSSNSYKIAVGIGIIVLSGVAVVLYRFHLFEAENVQRGSIAYYLGLPSSVRSIPIKEECQIPVYRWRGRNGESSPYISANYGSNSSSQSIIDFYKTALANLSCAPIASLPKSFVDKRLVQFNCLGPDILLIDVWVANEPSCRSVTLDIIENY